MEDVGEAILTTLDSKAIENAVHPATIDWQRLRTLAYLEALFHDLGKAHPAWQAVCLRAIYTGNDVTLPYHSSRSAFLAYALTDGDDSLDRLNSILESANKDVAPLDSELTQVERAALIISILHHHTQLSERNQQPKGSLINTSDLDELFINIGELDLFENRVPTVDIPLVVSRFKDTLKNIRGSKGTDTFAQIASLTTVLRSALIQADHHASSRVQTDTVTAPVPEMLSADKVDLYDHRAFQQQIDEAISGRSPPMSLCGIADCGAGKTQTAMQWGIEQQRAGNADRLVIAMPTRTTSNNLLHTITDDHTDPHNVALHHSSSEDIYTELFDDERTLNTIYEHPRYREWFQRPITVCTVDHLLATLINNDRNSSIARGNLRRAAVVFDEVHSYDRELLQKITDAVEYLGERKIPWYVMTATCPPQLERAFNPEQTIQANDSNARFHIAHHDDELTAQSVLDEFTDQNTQTAMVVKNTVREAQSLAKQLKRLVPADITVTYYSSEFPDHDRHEKERHVRDTFAPGQQQDKHILVCTQVCELSLDISVDTLYTDIAPMDALIQRGGRLHRHGTGADSTACDCDDCTDRTEPVEYTCHSFSDPTAESWYPYAAHPDSEEWILKTTTRTVLQNATEYTFDRSLRWMADVYSDYDMQIHRSTFRSSIITDELYGSPRWNGNKIPFRNQTHRRITVVPSEYTLHDTDSEPVSFRELWDDRHGHAETTHCLAVDEFTPCDDELYDILDEFGIAVPVWWIRGENSPISTYPVFPEAPRTSAQEIPLPYNYENGIQPPSDI